MGAHGRGDERAHSRQIEQMTALERIELERKFATYLNMSESEREEIHRLHAQLEQEPHLTAVMHRYNDWLQSLTPWQRDELRNESDPTARLKLVRKFQRDHEDRPPRGWLFPPESSRDRSSGRLRRLSHSRTRLTPEDMQSVLNVVERSVVVRDEDLEKLASLSGLSRYLFVLSIPIGPDTDEEGADSRESPQPSGDRLSWMNDRMLNDMINAISDESVRAKLDEPSIERRRREMAELIAKGLFSELREESANLKTDESQLRALLDGLDEQKRKDLEKDLMQLSPRDQQRRLKWLYLRQQNEELRNFWPIFRALVPRSRGDRDSRRDDKSRNEQSDRGRHADGPGKQFSRDRQFPRHDGDKRSGRD